MGIHSNKKLTEKKFNVFGYLIDASYMNDEYQARGEQKHGILITETYFLTIEINEPV